MNINQIINCEKSNFDKTVTESEDKSNRGEEINKEILKQMGLEMTLEQWQSKSSIGQLCGIIGCPATPSSQCTKCGNWYCNEHLQLHFHSPDHDKASEEAENR